MTDTELVCNFKKCRKRMLSCGWVTSCSHIFCEEDGEREFLQKKSSSTLRCPACTTVLPQAIDVIKADLNPSDQFKTMVLAGLRPEVIMDIASRALSFWSYQNHLEHMYKENSVKIYKDRISQLEVSYEALVAKIKGEMTGLQRQIEESKKDLAQQMKKTEELADKLLDKTKQCRKLQVMYDTIKRSSVISQLNDKDNSRDKVRYVTHTLAPRTVADVGPANNNPRTPQMHTFQHPQRPTPQLRSNDQGFIFCPITPPTVATRNPRELFSSIRQDYHTRPMAKH